MKVPISWLKEYVEISIPIEDLATKLTLAGLEVEEIRYVGLPLPDKKGLETKISGISWEPDEIVVGVSRDILGIAPDRPSDNLLDPGPGPLLYDGEGHGDVNECCVGAGALQVVQGAAIALKNGCGFSGVREIDVAELEKGNVGFFAEPGVDD